MGYVTLFGDTCLLRDGSVKVTVQVQGPDFTDEVRVRFDDDMGLATAGCRAAERGIQQSYAARAVRSIAEAIDEWGQIKWRAGSPSTAFAVLELAP